LAEKGSQTIYNILPKFRKQLTINCVVNVVALVLLGFYILRGKKLHDDYIQQCKPRTCMAMQTKAWITSLFFKEFLSFFKEFILGGIS
jgi:hypothetical protein